MPKGQVVEGSNYPLPQETLFTGELQKVEQVSFNFTYRKGPKKGTEGTLTKWVWTFGIVEGEFAGITVDGNTEPEVNNADGPKGSLRLARPWYEALLGRQLELGEPVDTDVLLGLKCQFTVEHQEPRPKKDGPGFWYNCEVADVFPVTASQSFVPF